MTRKFGRWWRWNLVTELGSKTTNGCGSSSLFSRICNVHGSWYCHKYLVDWPAASLNSKKCKGSGDDFCMREFEGIGHGCWTELTPQGLHFPYWRCCKSEGLLWLPNWPVLWWMRQDGTSLWCFVVVSFVDRCVFFSLFFWQKFWLFYYEINTFYLLFWSVLSNFRLFDRLFFYIGVESS